VCFILILDYGSFKFLFYIKTHVLTKYYVNSVCWLLVTANVPSSPILVTVMMEGLCFSETSVLTRATWRNIPEDGILRSHHRENLKSYKLDPLN
jgi:hypothetical protein